MRFGFGLVLVVGMLLAGCGLAVKAEEPASSKDASAQAYHLPPEKLAKAQALSRAEVTLHFADEAWGVLVLLLLLASGAAAGLAAWAGAITPRKWLQAMLFATALVVILFLAEMPAYVIGHLLSRHYGISVQGWVSWLGDIGKSLGLEIAIEVPIFMLTFGLLHWSPRRYWLWLWVGAIPCSVMGAVLLPAVIDPMFNKFEPLSASHPALVRQLQQVVARTGTDIPPERMFLMKASEKSNGLNAYVTGLGSTKRIVVWDTTADRMPTDQILFTFAHETGHYVLNHVAKGLAVGTVGLLIGFWLTARLAERLVRRRGMRWGATGLASLPTLVILMLVLTVLEIAAEPIANSASRFIEHQADVYGQEAIHGIVADPQQTAVAAFNTLGEAYLDDPSPNHFVEFWTYNHPSLQRRATFAAHYNPWAAGAPGPRFFPR